VGMIRTRDRQRLAAQRKRTETERERLAELVRQARADGATWAEIGEAVGMSQPAAWQRWSRGVGGESRAV
jgi:isopropylmalate/homocitrate/citramalate synthase